MQATIAAWLMATLTPSALMVALVQTASTAPSLLFGLLAGALADIVERRRVILVTQIMFARRHADPRHRDAAGMIGAVALLALTFLIGVGFTFYMPAQQASINELVARTGVAAGRCAGCSGDQRVARDRPRDRRRAAAWLGSGSALIASAVFFIGMIFAVRGGKPRATRVARRPRVAALRHRERPALRAALVADARDDAFAT